MQSWGRLEAHRAFRHDSLDATPIVEAGALPIRPGGLLPFGRGRSYGDCCLNDGGGLVLGATLPRVLQLRDSGGLVRVGAGLRIDEVLGYTIPSGWVLPVVPGTRHVTMGGAIANDIHGKNHGVAGSLGRHVRRLALLRSDGPVELTEADPLFAATIGGLGLTGLLLWADIQLQPVAGPMFEVQVRRFRSLGEYGELAASAEESGDHWTVAWLDAAATGRRLGRGLFTQGRPAPTGSERPPRTWRLKVPFDAPDRAINPLMLRAFNSGYFHARRPGRRIVPWDRFFFPLDRLEDWNRIYGRRGLYQYQCVVPAGDRFELVVELLKRVHAYSCLPFLNVFKTMGPLPSPGPLSFARPGATLAIDLPARGPGTLALMDELDALVVANGGALYPAKDARMSSATFRSGFPRWERLEAARDPACTSSFWRRVVG